MRQTDTYDERPGVAERYSTAIEASNLKAEADKGGAVDLIIAAGWSGDGMGASLYRLRAEYDGVARDVRGSGDTSATDHLLVMIHLKSLRETKQMLWSLALKQAEVKGFDRPEKDAAALVGRCLDVFLDPNCRPCEGRGFNGGGRHEQTGPQVICKRCKGSGKRAGEVGKDDTERRFADHLLYLMECSTSNAEQGMKRRLQSHSE